MADHNTLIGGAAGEIEGGTVLLSGVAYELESGTVLVNGVAQEIDFGGVTAVTITGIPYASRAYATIEGADINKTGTYEYKKPVSITVSVSPTGSNGGNSTIKLNGTQVASGDYYTPATYTFETYLKTMYVEIEQDVFASKYDCLDDEDIPF